MAELKHVRVCWPEPEPSPGEPICLFYELNEQADAVVRSVDFFADGTVTRNSIEIEKRGGHACPSLIDCSLAEGFDGVDLDEITRDEFEDVWSRGVDKPFWNVSLPPVAERSNEPLWTGTPYVSLQAALGPLSTHARPSVDGGFARRYARPRRR